MEEVDKETKKICRKMKKLIEKLETNVETNVEKRLTETTNFIIRPYTPPAGIPASIDRRRINNSELYWRTTLRR